MFFQHKEVKDPLAVKIWNQIGGDNLRKLPTYETNKKESVFVDLYKQARIGNNYDSLPNELKTKLIGVMKDEH